MTEEKKPRAKKSLADRLAFIAEQRKDAKDWLAELDRREAELIAEQKAKAQAILDSLPKEPKPQAVPE